MLHRFISLVLVLGTALSALLLAPATVAAAGPALQFTIHYPGKSGGGMDCMAIDPTTRRLYFAPKENQTVDVLDLATGNTIAQMPGVTTNFDPKAPPIAQWSGVNCMAVAPELHRLFVADAPDNSMHVFDTTTNTQTAVVPTNGKTPDAVTYDPTDKKVYVTNGDSNDVTVFDASSLKQVTQIKLPGGPELSAWDAFDGTVLQNMSGTHQMAKINPATDTIQVVFNMPAGCEPHGVAVNPLNQDAFIGCVGPADVVMNAGDGSIVSASPHAFFSDITCYDPRFQRFATVSIQAGQVAEFDALRFFDWLGNGDAKAATGSHNCAIDPSNGWIYIGAASGIQVFAPV